VTEATLLDRLATMSVVLAVRENIRAHVIVAFRHP
jgi:hypothetical protein